MAANEIDSTIAQINFSDPQAWLERGLNPSDPDVIAFMQRTAEEFLNSLKELQSGSADLEETVATLVDELPWDELDTEEREFLADAVAPGIKSLGVDPWHVI